MNRKRKINELYKGVFKNDKKSCLVDLRPLDKKRELGKELKEDQSKDKPIKENNTKIQNKIKTLGISLKVSKHAGFGTYFKKLREEINDIFLSKDEYISIDKMFNSNLVNDLFNYNKESLKKNNVQRDGIIRLNRSGTILRTEIQTNQSPTINNDTEVNKDEVILYEDEKETIYKRRKSKTKLIKLSEKKLNFYYDNEIQKDKIINTMYINEYNVPRKYEQDEYNNNDENIMNNFFPLVSNNRKKITNDDNMKNYYKMTQYQNEYLSGDKDNLDWNYVTNRKPMTNMLNIN